MIGLVIITTISASQVNSQVNLLPKRAIIHKIYIFNLHFSVF